MFDQLIPNADKLLDMLLAGSNEELLGSNIERRRTKDGVEVTFLDGMLIIRIDSDWVMPTVPIYRKWWQLWKPRVVRYDKPQLPPIPLVIAFANNKGQEMVYWSYSHFAIGETIRITPLKLGTVIQLG